MKSTALFGLAYAAVASAQGDLVSTLSGQEDLSTLLQVLSGLPSLVSTLGSAGNLTILAPTNEAFAAVGNDTTVGQAIASNDTDTITALLTYHVINGTVPASAISDTPTFAPTLLTNTAFANVTGGQRVEAVTSGENVTIISGDLSVSNVVQADINAGGSIIIHKIDRFLSIPQNVSSTAIAAGLYSAAGALTQAELIEAVDTTPNVTIFVPNNEAFQAVGSAFGNASIETLQSVLQYHVIAGTVAYSSDIKNGSVETLAGGEVTLTVANGAVFVNSAKVVIPNVLVANGVVHVIDSVLNPNSTAAPEAPNASAEPTVAFSGASSIAEAPFTSGLPEASTTLSVPTQATAAPTEAAGGAGESSASAAGGARAVATGMVGVVGAGALFAGAWVGI